MTAPQDPILSSGDNDATEAYLFRAGDVPAVYGVTHDPRAPTCLLPTPRLNGNSIERSHSAFAKLCRSPSHRSRC